MSTASAPAKTTPFKPNASQTSVLKQLAASGGTSTDYRNLIANGGNGLTLVRLSELGFVKISLPKGKITEKTYSLTAAGKKLAAKL